MGKLRESILGFILGDTLGVPVEFMPRYLLTQDPVKDLREFGTHNQPKGTWSDDSSMVLCTIESITKKQLNLTDLASRFIKWKNMAYWTAHNEVFDIGNQTANSLQQLESKISNNENLEDLRDNSNIYTNGNGSLMRVLPLSFYFEANELKVIDCFDEIWNISALTHPHILSALACTYYLLLIENLRSYSLEKAFLLSNSDFNELFDKYDIESKFSNPFRQIIEAKNLKTFAAIPENKIHSSGYVVDSLEASIWSLVNSKSYSEAVLKAVNLGEDTDTIGALTGGLAGFYFGLDQKAEKWINEIARIGDIQELTESFNHSLFR